MANTVSDVIKMQSKTLYEKLCENNHLGNVVMGLLGSLIIICQKSGKRIEGIKCGPVSESNGDFRFSLSYNTLTVSPPALWQMRNGDNLLEFIGAKSAAMAGALESNAQIISTFRDLVLTVERYCQHKGMEFRDFKIKKAFITPDSHLCVLRSGTETLDKWGR